MKVVTPNVLGNVSISVATLQADGQGFMESVSIAPAGTGIFLGIKIGCL